MVPSVLLPTLLLLLCDGVAALSPPSGLSVSSVNMRHTLSWLPLQDHCHTTVLYSVQYQGDFERLVLNGSWLSAARCQLTSVNHCELSTELGSDSDYNLRVRGHCGRNLSLWQQLAPPFNRRHTRLLEPVLKLDVLGDSLLVSIEDVPPICSVTVSLWRTGHEDQVQERVVRSEHGLKHRLLFDPLLEGEEYCIRAQTELPSGVRSSPTAPLCVHITGPEGSWKKPVTVAFTILPTVGFLCVVLWFIIHYKPQHCPKFIHKEPLPHCLEDWERTTPIQVQDQPSEQAHMFRVLPETSLPSAVALL